MSRPFVAASVALASVAAALAIALVAGCGDRSAAMPDAMPDAAPDALPDAAPDAPLPREPPDLRFQWVGAFPTYAQHAYTDIASGLTQAHHDEFAWAPLEIITHQEPQREVAWQLTDFSPVVSIDIMDSVASSGDLVSMNAAVSDLLAKNYVITSLDIYPTVYGLIATRPIATPLHGAPAYTAHPIDIDRAGLDAWVADQGQHGRVVTALSPTATGAAIHVLSFERGGDTTVYETHVADATFATLAASATTLADAGYIITAFGRNGDGPVLLIGTRPAGVTTPRTITVQTTPPQLGDQGALVAWLFDSSPPDPPFPQLAILER